MERYLVVGLAKTGTTVISKTIQNTLGLNNYFIEPTKVSFFESFGAQPDTDGVVKILFDQWFRRPRLLNAIVFDELRCGFKAQIFITRDPRAEFISRLHYLAYPYFSEMQRRPEDREDWIDLFRAKQSDPEIPLSVMLETLRERFGCRVQPGNVMVERYAELIARLPSHRCTPLRYEDFVAGTLSDHPLAHLFSGSRDVGPDLSRTRRSAGNEDWMSFVTDADIGWMDQAFAPLCTALGYSPGIPEQAVRDRLASPVSAATSSDYVARLIDEATDLAVIRNAPAA